MKKIRILLDDKDFTALISGEIIIKDNVRIALQDIGYDVMLNIIRIKYNELWKQK